MDSDKEFFTILSQIDDEKVMEKFLTEILTAKELKDLCLRWRLLGLIKEKVPQRQIASQLGISLCKITRGSKLLKDTSTITYSILNKEKPGD
ncbi:MAG: Trp family transcriptional regulator [Sedimentisphaeraceae bacterium JB056]